MWLLNFMNAFGVESPPVCVVMFRWCLRQYIKTSCWETHARLNFPLYLQFATELWGWLVPMLGTVSSDSTEISLRSVHRHLDLCLLSLFLCDSSGLAMLFPTVLSKTWEWNWLSWKHLRMLGTLDGWLQLYCFSVETKQSGKFSISDIVLCCGRGQGGTIGVAMFIIF